MDDQLVHVALEKLRQGEIPGDVAVVLDREIGSPGADGRTWRFLATNGHRCVAVEAELSGSNGGEPGYDFDPTLLEAAVERRISGGYYLRDRLMEELGADGPISLRREDLRRHPPPDGSIFS
jgi:hypothetical protein